MLTSTYESPLVFLIMGATGGIGSHLARRLSRRGWLLALVGRDEKKLNKLASETAGVPLRIEDVRKEEVDRVVRQTVADFGRLDGAVNLIGSILLKPAHLTSEAEWEETIATNLSSAFYLLHSACKVMRSEGGSIVLTSSAAGRLGLPNHEAIAAAKAGIIGLAKSAAASYASHRIRVNCVAPGLVETPLTNQIAQNPASRTASEAMHPLGRLGDPEEVASAIEWFLDPTQGWITGQVLGVDGGLSTVRTHMRSSARPSSKPERSVAG